MSASPAGSPIRPASVHTRRCVRHSTREAAARCPGCSGFFCRECVVEHGGRVLCVECLARAAAARAVKPRRWWSARQTVLMVSAGAAAWLSFYGLGLLLLKIPPGFHDGTIWSATPAEEP